MLPPGWDALGKDSFESSEFKDMNIEEQTKDADI